MAPRLQVVWFMEALERKKPVWIALVASVALISLGHYLFAPSMGITHNVLQRLYYAPIILAAFRFGRRGGVIIAALSSLSYVPHIVTDWSDAPMYQMSQFIELGMYFIVGALTGELFTRQMRSHELLRSYERMALFGGLSRAVIRSLKAPIKTLQGMLVSLEVIGRKNVEIGLCVDVMRDQVDKVATLRSDLISLVERKKLRLRKQSLKDIGEIILSEMSPLLELRSIKVSTRFSAGGSRVYCNRRAILNVLHYMIGMMLDSREKVEQVTFYQGESAEFAWIGASLSHVQLDVYLQSSLSVLESDQYGYESLIEVIHTMNNHFGAFRLRRERQRVAEFVLVFPKKLSLPWYLIDNEQSESFPSGSVSSHRAELQPR